VKPAEVDVLLSWALVPERISPSNATQVAHLLGLPRAWAMGVDAACASIVPQLELASALIEAGRATTVLLTQSHLLTRAMPPMHPASPNVGDAAIAVVVCASERAGILTSHAISEGAYYDSVTWRRGRERSEDAPWWQSGGDFYIGSNSPESARYLMQNTVGIGAQTVRELMARADLPVESIDILASVQPRGWVPGAIAEVLGLRAERAPQTFDRYAHLGGAGAVVNLLEARRLGMLQRGARVVLYAQGAGFTRGAVLLDWAQAA
jgi:3-oxoacyl-[acyl-carrier-protein] synthase-3